MAYKIVITPLAAISIEQGYHYYLIENKSPKSAKKFYSRLTKH